MPTRFFPHYRWSDNQHTFGPLLYSRDGRSYRPTSVMLDSGDGDEHPGCRLRLRTLGHTFIFALPSLLAPKTFLHHTSRGSYTEKFPREFGLTWQNGHLSIHYGAQTHDSTTTKQWGWFAPWRERTLVESRYYDRDGVLWAKVPGKMKWLHYSKIQEDCPTRWFEFLDFDNEKLSAAVHIEETEYSHGTRWCSWLRYLRANEVYRRIDIKFIGEVGKRKGSWKGGTIGHSAVIGAAELHEEAFRRYCVKEELVFIGELDEAPKPPAIVESIPSATAEIAVAPDPLPR